MMHIVIVAFVIVAIIFLTFLVSTRNTLVKLRNRVRNQLSQVDVALTERAALIPNLVSTVKGYAAHEKETLNAVIAARQQTEQASSVTERVAANQEMSKALTHIFALAEQYPDLKANQNFIELQTALKETERRIGLQRQFYNDMVTKYNTYRESFPNNIAAAVFGFKPMGLFEAVENDKVVPTVSF